MKRYIRSAVDIKSIIRNLKQEYDDVELVTFDDEIVIWTVAGNKCSLNYKGMNQVDVEREMFDISEEID